MIGLFLFLCWAVFCVCVCRFFAVCDIDKYDASGEDKK